MKRIRFLICAVALIAGTLSTSAEARFFKANSVCLKYVYYRDYAVPTDDPNGEFPPLEYYHAEMWTGNDTIVEGYSCIELWDQDEGGTPVCIGFIREDDNGWVWRYEISSRFLSDDGKIESLEGWGIANTWTFLYDFSRSDWEVGMYWEHWGHGTTISHQKEEIIGVSTMALLNGEEIRVANGGIIYGIGYLSCPFEGQLVVQKQIFKATVLEYWRDGELLIQNESPEGINPTVFSVPASAPLYDLLGRPADGAKKGIYIRNGKKVLVR